MVQRSQAYCAPVFSIQEARIERLLQEAERITAAASGQGVRPAQPAASPCSLALQAAL